MKRTFALIAVLILMLAVGFLILLYSNSNQFNNSTFIGNDSFIGRTNPIPMPVEKIKKYEGVLSLSPIPQRDEEFRKYLAPSLRLGTEYSGGSATIVYYDNKTNTAWAISCGHFFAPGYSKNERQITLTAFYHNEIKLQEPRKYNATIHFYYHYRTKDISIASFHPDWEPDIMPIATEGFKVKIGEHYHSTGCDRLSEVANYDVKIINYEDGFYITKDNSPRPGRSGGGLMTSDGQLIGICVRTSDTNGNGIGMFIPHDTIVKTLKEEGYGWLLEASFYNSLRHLPILDMNNPQGEYDNEYIPYPQNH